MIIVLRRYYFSDVVNNPWLTYVFGDNDERSGHGGQAAACRECVNTIGVRTKKDCGTTEESYYTDDEYEDNVAKIAEDLEEVEALLNQGNLVIFPQDGIGTGRALLRVKAPRTFAYLNNCMRNLMARYWIQKTPEIPTTKVFGLEEIKGAENLEKNALETRLAILQQHLRDIEVAVDDLHPLMLRRAMADMERLLLKVRHQKLRNPIRNDSCPN